MRGGLATHIILIILKVILFAILAVLGLLVLLFGIVLLVPIRYRVSGKKADTVDAKIQVHWLLHLVSVLFMVEQGKVTVLKVKLFGVTLIDLLSGKEQTDKEQRDQEQEQRDQEKRDKEQKDTAEPSKGVLHASSETENNQAGSKKETPKEALESNTKKKNPRKNRKQSQKTIPKNKIPLSQRLSEELERFCNTIDGVLDRLDEGIDAFWDKVSPVLDTISTYYTFATEDVTVRLIRKVFALIVDFIKYILPVKLRGNLHLGMAEPAATGQICSIMAVLLPWYGEVFTFTPDFERQVVEGEICCKGRIRIGHFVWKVLLLICSKDFWYVIKQWRAISGKQSKKTPVTSRP